MPSQKKQAMLKTLEKEIGSYSVVGILDMDKLPARQLMEIREALRGKAVIKMYKKRVIKLALSKRKGMESLTGNIQKMPAMLFSNENPFKLAQVIAGSKSMAAAKAGDIAPSDITVRAGPTGLMAGPVIGELQRAKIPAGMEEGKIAIKKDTVVAAAGSVIDANLANILSKLKVKPMEIGLNLICAYEDGYTFQRAILFKPKQAYIDEMKHGFMNAFSLTVSLGIPTKDNIKFLISKAHREAFSLAMEAGIVTKETLKPLLALAEAQAKVLEASVKLEPAIQQEAK